MTRSGLLVGVASVLAATTVLMAVFGLVYNPILLGAAVPFAAATYFLWSHATGRLGARMRERARAQAVDGREGAGAGRERPGQERPAAPERSPGKPGPADLDAASVLGVAPDADETTIRRAFRERARDLHPDAPGGDEAAFRRVRAAYERLRSDR